MKSREIISALQQDEWIQKGRQVQFKRSTKKCRVTVPSPERAIPIGTLKSIEKTIRSQAEVRTMRRYLGLIHKDADSYFGVSFPDFPGVITAGTSLDDIMSEPDNRSGVAILVPTASAQHRE